MKKSNDMFSPQKKRLSFTKKTLELGTSLFVIHGFYMGSIYLAYVHGISWRSQALKSNSNESRDAHPDAMR